MSLYKPYDPTYFEKDKAYLNAEQRAYVEDFMTRVFPLNYKKMELVLEDTTKAFIESGTNLYNKGVDYPDWKDELGIYPIWVENRAVALNILDKYRRINKQAAFYTFIKDEEPGFLPLHASDYLPLYDDNKISGCIIRTGQFPKGVSGLNSAPDTIEKWWTYYAFVDNKTYKCTAETWMDVPAIGENPEGNDKYTGWELLDLPDWKIMPVTFIGGNFPVVSSLPMQENRLATGVAYADLTQKMQFINFVYGLADLPQADFEKYVSIMGAIGVPNFPVDPENTNTDILKVLDRGKGEVPEKWQQLISDSLKRMAFAEGVDTQAFMPDVKVESGISRLMQTLHVHNSRDNNIMLFKDFEMRDQEKLISLGIISEKSMPVFSPLELVETKSDKEGAESKRIANIEKRYELGTITKAQMISELEGLTIEEAQERLSEIRTEKGLSETDVNLPVE